MELIILVILIIVLMGGFAGRWGGPGYGYGTMGLPNILIILLIVVVVVWLLRGHGMF